MTTPKDYLTALLTSDVDLTTEAAWHLSKKAAHLLADETGMEPRGGWEAFTALVAGTPHLKAGRKRFERQTDRVEEDLGIMFFDVFRKKLVPPGLAAGLFIVLGIHPAWGLRVTHARHTRYVDDTSTWQAEALFPPDVLETLDGAIDRANDAIIDILRARTQGYLSSIVEMVDGDVTEIREDLHGAFDDDEILKPVLDIDNQWRIPDYLTEVFTKWLVPAGFARLEDDAYELTEAFPHEETLRPTTSDETNEDTDAAQGIQMPLFQD